MRLKSFQLRVRPGLSHNPWFALRPRDIFWQIARRQTDKNDLGPVSESYSHITLTGRSSDPPQDHGQFAGEGADGMILIRGGRQPTQYRITQRFRHLWKIRPPGEGELVVLREEMDDSGCGGVNDVCGALRHGFCHQFCAATRRDTRRFQESDRNQESDKSGVLLPKPDWRGDGAMLIKSLKY